jgi:hypothetical protein
MYNNAQHENASISFPNPPTHMPHCILQAITNMNYCKHFSCCDPQLLQLLLDPTIHLLRLSLAGADKRHLGAQRAQPALDGLLLARLEDAEPGERVAGLLESDVGIGNLVAERLGAVLVPAQVQRELLFELVALFGGCEERFEC